MKTRIFKILPWFIAGSIFFFLFKKIPPVEVLRTMMQVNIPLFTFYATAYFVVVLNVDCFGLRWGINRFSTSVTFKETLFMRGATYPLMLINYNLAQGGIAFYLKRTHQAPLFKTLGTILYLTLIDLMVLLTLGLISACFHNPVFGGLSLRPVIVNLSVVFFSCFFLWAFLWRQTNHPVVLSMRRLRLIDWLLSQQVFHPFRESKFQDYLKVLLIRTPTVILVMLSYFLWIHGMRSHVPLSDLMTYTPLIMILATLPITPAGLGTLQVLCMALLTPNLDSPLTREFGYTPDQIILAGSLLWLFSNSSLKILFGLYCLKYKSANLFSPQKTS